MADIDVVVLTEEDYAAALNGDTFRSILDFIEQIKDYDLSRIKDLMDAIAKLASAATLKDTVKAGLEILQIIAEITPTKADDKLIAVLKSVLTDELLDILTRLLGGLLGSDARAQYNVAEDAVAITAVERSLLESKGIPLSSLFQLALQLLALLEQFKGKSQAATA